jgi:hypothetical protein
MTKPAPEHVGPIELVREGMRVVDAAGDEVGRVRFVKLGDPEAVTTQGEQVDPAFRDDDGEPLVPPPLRARLLRLGFVKIDAKGLFKPDRYAAATDIARVHGDTVHLAVKQDQLLVES